MSDFKSVVRSFARDEDGASMAEYALLLGVITVALIGVITLFRDQISSIFSTTTSTLGTAGS